MGWKVIYLFLRFIVLIAYDYKIKCMSVKLKVTYFKSRDYLISRFSYTLKLLKAYFSKLHTWLWIEYRLSNLYIVNIQQHYYS